MWKCVAIVSFSVLLMANNDLEPKQIAPVDEPGEVMVVRGTVYQHDGNTPAANVTIHLYHTDHMGLYRRPGTDDPEHRLEASLITDSQGRYAFRSIRPAHYPDGGPPAHVHFEITDTQGASHRFTMFFTDDPKLSPRMRNSPDFGTPLSSVVAIAKNNDGTWQVTKNFVLP